MSQEAAQRPSLRCFETRPRCMECPCMACGEPFDVSVYHYGKDAPAALGDVPKHYYNHPSVQVVHLLDKARTAAEQRAYRRAAEMAADAIDLFLEYRTSPGYEDDDVAKAAALGELYDAEHYEAEGAES